MSNDQSLSTNEDTGLAITLTATDPDLDPLSYSIVSNPSNGTLSGTAPNVFYTPNLGFTGTDSFTFEANDGVVSSNTATITLTVNPAVVNSPPVSNDQSLSTNEDTGLAITLTATDPDLDPLSYSIVSNPSNGTLSGTAPNVFYTPNLGFTGTDSFTFEANDGVVSSNTATITLTVNPAV